MDKYNPQLKKFYYDASKYPTYLDQLGIKYPTLRNESARLGRSRASRFH